MLNLAILALPLLQGTHIVDANGGPGSNFTDLPPAVAAAANGDTILVRAGTYSGFTTSKVLRVFGAGKSVTKIIGTSHAVKVNNTPAHETFELAGFECRGGPATNVAGIVLYNSSMTLLDCDVFGGPTVGMPALRADFATVHVSRCSLTGSDCPLVYIWCSEGGAGAFLRDSFFSAVDSTFQGGDGTSHPIYANITLAGHGLVVGESDAVLSRCDVYGGFGPIAWGGHAIHCWAGNTHASGTANNVLQGGEAATLYAAPHLGIPGTITTHGPINVLPSAGNNTIAVGPVTLGQPEFPHLDVQGVPLPDGALDAAQPAIVAYDGLVANAPFFFMFGFRSDYDLPGATQTGPLLVDIHTAGLVFGTLDAAGQFSFAVPTNVLAPVYGLPIYAQAGTYDASLGLLRTSNASVSRFSL